MLHIHDNSPVPFRQFLRPDGVLRHYFRHRHLLRQFLAREVQAKYRGSALGMLWTIITPLVMLLVYTFVFAFIFRSRWGEGEAVSDFSLMLFTGFIAYNVFAETVLKAPLLVTGHPNLVKRVVFPVEILPLSVLGAMVVQSLCSLVILLCGVWIIQGTVHPSTLWLPLCYVPLVALTAGMAWVVAALGVFLPDVGQFVAVAMQLLFFLTPIVYPPTLIPEAVRPLIYLNPLAGIIELFRDVLVLGLPPHPLLLAGESLVALAVMLLGHAVFMKSKRAFADVM